MESSQHGVTARVNESELDERRCAPAAHPRSVGAADGTEARAMRWEEKPRQTFLGALGAKGQPRLTDG